MFMVQEATTGILVSIMMACVLLASCAPDLAERVRAYESTYNAHDVEKLMAFYADDIRFEIVGVWVKRGKEPVRELAEWDKTTNMHVTISDISVNGNTVTCKLIETNDWWKLAGMGEVHYEPTVLIFRDGLICDIRATMTQEGVDAYARVWPDIISWAKSHRNEVLKELVPGNEFVYGAEAARIWLALLRDWHAAQER